MHLTGVDQAVHGAPLVRGGVVLDDAPLDAHARVIALWLAEDGGSAAVGPQGGGDVGAGGGGDAAIGELVGRRGFHFEGEGVEVQPVALADEDA